MQKLGQTIYNKLEIQAQEAKFHGLNKLAERLALVLEQNEQNKDFSNDEYSRSQLKDHICQDLWKMASRIVTFYDLESLDVLDLDNKLSTFAEKTLNQLEEMLSVDGLIKGAHEAKLPGEKE